ncbi:MAG: hypothetical protein K2G91_05280, partial [Prevotella sp.]|nr:hypothetical protein [Prevotella sp.]
VLIDFGLVKHFDSNGKPTTRLAAKGASDGFAPMEQYTTIDSFAPTLDVYALGATLYYLLKGKNPPKAFDIESSAVLKDALPVTVSEKTRNAIACAMEKSKFERTPTVSAFLSALSDGESFVLKDPAIEIKTKAKTKTTRFKDKEAVGLNRKKVVIGIVVAIVICAIQGFVIMMCSLVFWEICNDSNLQTNDVYEEIEAVDAYEDSDVYEDSILWDDEINGHEYVDLGLPSGVKWATCNVGASSPSDYGDYFAWGEITTKSEYTRENSKTYDKKNGDISGNFQYDAARSNWGGSWRLPSKAEFEELIDKCTWTWTSQGIHSGYKVVGSNGNSIFFPAAGCRDGSSLYYAGGRGYYWSSTPDEDYTNNAYFLCFRSGDHSADWNGGHGYGHSVRPVSD